MQQFTFIQAVRHLFSLADDKSEADAIDEEIRSNVTLRGTNLWVLILAILIASVGLDVNSTAVVIGAMLISPLMGPIMGIGYGIGVYDFPLIRKSMLSLSVATLIAFLTSTIYFLLSPLSEAHSELLARTSPTIWDVLIAFFGGLAGIIASTRKIKTNVVPGVAIATALMPPLCTAGYGLANGNWSFFLGASYLYVINSVFIAFAAVIIISSMKLPHRNYVDEKTESRVKIYLSGLILITMVPSLYLAYNLVKEEVFTIRAKSFINQEFQFDETYYTDLDIDAKKKKIELSLIGKPIAKEKLEKIQAKLIKNELQATSLVVHQASEQTIDTLSLKSSIIADLYKQSQIDLATIDKESQAALVAKDKQIASLQDKLKAFEQKEALIEGVTPELHSLFPEISNVVIASGVSSNSEFDVFHKKVTVLVIYTKQKFSKSNDSRLKAWLARRLNTEEVQLVYQVKKQ